MRAANVVEAIDVSEVRLGDLVSGRSCVQLDQLSLQGLEEGFDGGGVLPTLHYGAGGGHGVYSWPMMMPRKNEIAALLDFIIGRLKEFGFKLVVLFSNHFPSEQLSTIDRLSEKWSDDSFKVFATAVNRIEGLSLASDHGAIFETTQHAAMWPALFQMDKLRSLQEAASTANDS